MQKPSFQFSFSVKGKIWRAVPDPGHGKLILEIRTPDVQLLTFRLLDLHIFREEPDFSIQEADWWSTAICLNYPLLLLEQYVNPQDPTEKALIVYDIAAKRMLHREENFHFTDFSRDSLLGHHPRDRNEQKDIHLPGAKHRGREVDEVSDPFYFSPGSEGMDLVQQFLDSEPSGLGCEYLEEGNYIIISYYVRSTTGTNFSRMLLVLNGDDELYHEVQDVSLDGFAAGAFFVWNGLLIFIKNGKQINGIQL